MPARNERIFICPRENGLPGWVMDFPAWWDRNGFFEKFGLFDIKNSRWFDTGNPWYVDYAMLLTTSEASTWDKECRKVYMEKSQNMDTGIIEAMRQLKTKLDASSWVIVESYEWESGMD